MEILGKYITHRHNFVKMLSIATAENFEHFGTHHGTTKGFDSYKATFTQYKMNLDPVKICLIRPCTKKDLL